jgi:GntR family transcriptional regulator
MSASFFSVNPYSSEPVYEQLKSQIKKGIYWGSLKPGERLPTIKELSMALSVNPNTIAKAFRELILEGYLIGEPGVGTFINERNQQVLDEQKVEYFRRLILDCLKEGKVMGFKCMEMDSIWKDALGDFGKEEYDA